MACGLVQMDVGGLQCRHSSGGFDRVRHPFLIDIVEFLKKVPARRIIQLTFVSQNLDYRKFD